jgi:hypothetical protein
MESATCPTFERNRSLSGIALLYYLGLAKSLPTVGLFIGAL